MLIDRTRLDTLRQDVGDDFFAEVVAMSVEELDDAMATLDPPDAAKMHFLKGSALNAGLADLSALCATGEAALRADPGATVALDAIQQTYARSRAQLLAECQT